VTAALSRAVTTGSGILSACPIGAAGSIPAIKSAAGRSCHTSISAEVTNALNCSYLQLYRFMVWCFDKHRGSLMTVVDLYG
jgi:hypothetical protein